MINLLPLKYRKEIIFERRTRDVILTMIALAGVSLFVFINLWLAALYFSVERDFQNGLLSSYGEKAAELSAVENKIIKLNEKISRADDYLRNKARYISLVGKTSSLLPKGVYLTALKAARRGQIVEVYISGRAANDQALFEFKENLSREKTFGKISFPMNAWTKLEDITFNDASFQWDFREK